MNMTRLSGLALSFILLSACSSKPVSDYDINYDFSQLKTFIEIPSPQSQDPLTANRIQTAINANLLAKGFVIDTQQPDFEVTYSFKTKDKPKDSAVSIGLGSGGWGGSGISIGVPIGRDTVKLQTIQIDIMSPQTQRLLWRGSDTFKFGTNSQLKAEATQDSVNNILQQFPPQAH